MGSGIGVTAFGFADEEWTKAVTAQLMTLQHTSNLYYTQPCAKLAKVLCERTGLKKVFFSNSDAEANACAIKVARGCKRLRRRGIEGVILELGLISCGFNLHKYHLKKMAAQEAA